MNIPLFLYPVSAQVPFPIRCVAPAFANRLNTYLYNVHQLAWNWSLQLTDAKKKNINACEIRSSLISRSFSDSRVQIVWSQALMRYVIANSIRRDPLTKFYLRLSISNVQLSFLSTSNHIPPSSYWARLARCAAQSFFWALRLRSDCVVSLKWVTSVIATGGPKIWPAKRLRRFWGPQKK